MASKWVEREVEFIKSLNRPYETIDIEASEEEIEKALERFDRRSTIYIWSTEFSFNQALARELMNKSFRVSLLPTDFFERPASYNPVSDGYLIMLISRELTPAETDAVEGTAIRYCNYTYPVVIDEEGRKNWKLFRDIQNLDGIRTKEHLFKPDSERIAAIVKAQRIYYNEHHTLNLNARIDALRRLRSAIVAYEQRLAEALWLDLHKSYEEAYLTEISIVLAEIDNFIKHLKGWAAPSKKKTPIKLMPSKSIRSPYDFEILST
jgi:hypothetical protein